VRNKKIFIGVAVLVAAILIIAVAIAGRRYYQNRYVGSEYYTMIPADYDVSPETIYGADGVDMGLGKEYTLRAYDEAGQAKDVSFNVYAPGGTIASSAELPKPGEFLKLNASRDLVLNWHVIDESQVPATALSKIKQ
jgi:uncharacterized protein (TIGR01655 family)